VLGLRWTRGGRGYAEDLVNLRPLQIAGNVVVFALIGLVSELVAFREINGVLIGALTIAFLGGLVIARRSRR